MYGPARRACSFLRLFYPARFLDGAFSKAYERAVMRTLLVAKVIDRSGPLCIYIQLLCFVVSIKLK
jgi:hypothetical protein